MMYAEDEDEDYVDERCAQLRKEKLLAKLRHIPPGHPDEGDILDALEGDADE